MLNEFRSPLVIILLGASALLSLVSAIGDNASEAIDASLILFIVIANALLGFVQNYRAHRGIEALARLAVPICSVLRNGRPADIEASQLVPGDLVLLEEGSRVPADGRIVEAYDLGVDESTLTGESLTVSKTVSPVDLETALAERKCMVYMGTVVMRDAATWW